MAARDDRNATGLHEQFEARTEVRRGSDRSLGIVFAGVFAVVGVLPWIGGGQQRTWALAVAGLFLAAAALAPAVLAPLNRLWFRFGLLLHRVVNPLIMGLLFFAVVTPTGLILRAFGKDVLRLKPDPRAESYWIKRAAPVPGGESFKNQF